MPEDSARSTSPATAGADASAHSPAAGRDDRPAIEVLPFGGSSEADPVENAPLLILGGHRSGTSLVAGLLWYAGLYSGELIPANPENPRGFYEPAAIVEAHEGILNDQQRDWTCPPLRLDANVVDIAPLEAAVAGLRADGRPWGCKDPRLLFTLPVWIRLVPAMRLVGIVRHPAAVAASLHARNGFSPEDSRVVADLYVERLAGLQGALGFPVIDFDAEPDVLMDKVRSIVEAMGLSWDDAKAARLYDPALRHQRPEGGGSDAYRALLKAAGQDLPLESFLSTTVESAFAALDDPDRDPGPLHLGLGFELRRNALWEFGRIDGPELGRVLDIAPKGSRRPKPLYGVDEAERDLVFLDGEGRIGEETPDGQYTHVVLTGVLERISRDQLTSLLHLLSVATAPDAMLLMDGLVVDGGRIPPAKRWAHLSITSSRSGGPLHHHLDEIELAALESEWLIGDVVLGAGRRGLVKLVKQPNRSAKAAADNERARSEARFDFARMAEERWAALNWLLQSEDSPLPSEARAGSTEEAARIISEWVLAALEDVAALRRIAIPREFDELGYLRANTDVADAVRSREYSSGFEHFFRFGGPDEGRSRPT